MNIPVYVLVWIVFFFSSIGYIPRSGIARFMYLSRNCQTVFQSCIELKKKIVFKGLLWWSTLPMQGAWVQSLVTELRTHMPHSMAKKN